ncbi:hypothetical protein [Roseivirga sp.]|uniref:hypothetical protein n=1 Tax=Roseivirga sp. TaxID=1964215 RepID=UPI003B51759A
MVPVGESLEGAGAGIQISVDLIEIIQEGNVDTDQLVEWGEQGLISLVFGKRGLDKILKDANKNGALTDESQEILEFLKSLTEDISNWMIERVNEQNEKNEEDNQ